MHTAGNLAVEFYKSKSMRNNDTAYPPPPRPASRYGIRVCPRKNARPGDSPPSPLVLGGGIIVRRAVRVVQEDGAGRGRRGLFLIREREREEGERFAGSKFMETI